MRSSRVRTVHRPSSSTLLPFLRSMKLALFGGTFDPIHFGHLLIAESARQAFNVRVAFLPAGIPPHKAAPAASPQHRLRMVQLATQGNPHFTVEPWEMDQARLVYTQETLAHFRRRVRIQDLFFIIGSDSLRDIDHWRGGRALLKECTFLIVERPEVPWTSLPASLRRLTRRVPSPRVPFASHQIRRDLAARKSIRYQVPAAVETYIRARGLYRARPAVA